MCSVAYILYIYICFVCRFLHTLHRKKKRKTPNEKPPTGVEAPIAPESDFIYKRRGRKKKDEQIAASSSPKQKSKTPDETSSAMPTGLIFAYSIFFYVVPRRVNSKEVNCDAQFLADLHADCVQYIMDVVRVCLLEYIPLARHLSLRISVLKWTRESFVEAMAQCDFSDQLIRASLQWILCHYHQEHERRALLACVDINEMESIACANLFTCCRLWYDEHGPEPPFFAPQVLFTEYTNNIFLWHHVFSKVSSLNRGECGCPRANETGRHSQTKPLCRLIQAYTELSSGQPWLTEREIKQKACQIKIPRVMINLYYETLTIEQMTSCGVCEEDAIIILKAIQKHARRCTPIPAWRADIAKFKHTVSELFLRSLCELFFRRQFPRIRITDPSDNLQYEADAPFSFIYVCNSCGLVGNSPLDFYSLKKCIVDGSSTDDFEERNALVDLIKPQVTDTSRAPRSRRSKAMYITPSKRTQKTRHIKNKMMCDLFVDPSTNSFAMLCLHCEGYLMERISIQNRVVEAYSGYANVLPSAITCCAGCPVVCVITDAQCIGTKYYCSGCVFKLRNGEFADNKVCYMGDNLTSDQIGNCLAFTARCNVENRLQVYFACKTHARSARRCAGEIWDIERHRLLALQTE